MIARRIPTAIVCMLALAAGAPRGMPLALAAQPTPADADGGVVVSIDHPTVKVGERAVIVATLSAREGFRITESYRHRIVNLAATDDGVEVERKVVRGSVTDGRVVFRVDVVPKTAGDHLVVGVLRFSVISGQQLDIKAAPFEATVTAIP
jgi:hypothetical protein